MGNELDLPFDPAKVADPNFVVPDLTEATEGWRAWRVSGTVPKYGTAPKLYSANRGDYYWVPRRVMIAECARCDPDELPGDGCRCGFYSAKTYEHLKTMPYYKYDGERNGEYVIVGQVANLGNVIEGSLGWRAQKSYPVKLFVPYEIWKLMEPLREAYGCDTQLMDFLNN